MAEDQSRVFCGNLPFDITEDEIRTVFNTYGQVMEVRIIDDKRGQGKCAFVNYSASEGGAAAIQVLNNVYKFRHDSESAIRVSCCKPKGQYQDEKGWKGGGKGGDSWGGDGGWGGGGGGGGNNDTRNLFVGQLPMDITEDEIRTVFNTYGSVQDVNIIDGKPAGTHKCAFVKYDSEEAGRTAIQVLHHVYKFRHDSEKPINVDCQKPRGKDGGGKGKGWGGDGPYGGGGKGYGGGGDGGYGGGYDGGKGYGKGYDQGGGYGGGWDGKGGWDDGKGKGGGYGGDGYGKGGGYGGGDKGKGPRPDRENPPGPKLFISNLPTDIDQDTMRTVFGTYGSLTDVHVMTGRGRNGQSAAFVTYSSEFEATQAVQAMSQGYEIRPGQGNIEVKYADAKGKGGGKGFDKGKGKW